MLELARNEDFLAVNDLAAQVHALHVAWRPDIYEPVPQLYSQERFNQAIRERKLYVAKIRGVCVGYLAVFFKEYDWPGVIRRKVMVIDEIVVDEFCRNQGIGTQMVEDARALAKAFRCTDMQLGVYPQNDAAVGFYQKCGFTIRSIDMQRKV